MSDKNEFPVVLDWAVDELPCPDAERNTSSYACRSLDSVCVNSTNGPRYRCNCSSGFRGNTYLNGSGSCQVMGSSWINLIVKKRKLMKQREIHFEKNGGFMLRHQLSAQEGSIEKARIFTVEDLKRATNNYDESRIIGKGGFGIVYKGVLLDNIQVTMKKSKISDQTYPQQSHASSLSWELRLKIAVESARAIAYIHYGISTTIIHRHIKSANILPDDGCTPKVSDFGASRLVPLNQTQLTTLVQGTFGYVDPEYFHSG
ncbi:hypothetical protein LguiB_017771 [Lonicera macranthoides]